MIMIFLLILIFVPIFIYLKVIRPQRCAHDAMKNQGVPCEPFIPIFGQVFDMIRANKQNTGLEYFIDLARKHGNYYVMSWGPLTRLVISEPELLADILSRSKAENYEKTSVLTNILKPYIGVHNLLLSKHDEHERARKMLNPAFHSINLQSMIPIMSNETVKFIDQLLSKSTNRSPIRLDSETSALTLSIIASCAFGQSLENKSDGRRVLCQVFIDTKDIAEYRTLRLINQFEFLDRLPFWGKHIVVESRRRLNEFVDQAVIDRRSGQSTSLCSGEDILDLLLSATDDKGLPFTDEQIRDEALTFVLAGHETTGTLITWALYVLMEHPDILEACQEEVDRVLPNGTIPTHDHLSQLQIIDAVIHETLRLYPSAPMFGRQCVKSHTISSSDGQLNIHVAKGTMLVTNVYGLHRREDYWPHALKFDYKRWMRDPITGLKPKLPHPFAFIPFAAGPRNCIGQNFALLEGKIILAMLVQRCLFQLVPGQIIVPEAKNVAMVPKYGLYSYVNKREVSI